MTKDTNLYARAWYNNLTVAELKAFIEERGSACEICGKLWNDDDHGGGLVIDHDGSCCATSRPRSKRYPSIDGRPTRRCGKCLRGLLCVACNAGLGQFQDSPDRLRAAAAYLERKPPAAPPSQRYWPRGADHNQAKLTDEQVREIRALWAGGKGGWTKRALGKEFGVSETTVGLIVTRKRWGHVPDHVPLTAERKAEIAAKFAAGGIRQVDLANQYGVTQTRISRVLQQAGVARGRRRDSNGHFM